MEGLGRRVDRNLSVAEARVLWVGNVKLVLGFLTDNLLEGLICRESDLVNDESTFKWHS